MSRKKNAKKTPKKAKKRVFRQFWPLDGVEISQKHRFWTRSVQLPLFRHLARLSTFSGCETVNVTPVATPVATPIVTPVATPIATPSVTPVATPDATPVATPVILEHYP